MHLKKLELVGFKSFPEKTQFLFTEGVTAIVGPNGCGKSNLLDALRWVLGEQKTSLLRGTKMEEVIFAGTRNLKPLGMSEVSLLVDNKDGGLRSPYTEILVTRRLFRSGESEYLINKTPCRLKDITDIFADTGVGAHAYAIIQQEMVDAILSDKTEERRFLFEEAAGITRYKHRKRAAERKLAATEQDLLRLQDILAEVTTRVRSLKRQVNKAQRYKEISDELKAWDLYSAQTRYGQLSEERRQLAVNTKTLEDKKLGFDTLLDTRFAELEAARTTLTDTDGDLSAIAARVLELSEQAHRLETDISVKREKRHSLGQSVSQSNDDITALKKRADVITDEKNKLGGELETVIQLLDRIIKEFESASIRQKEADAQYLHFREIAEGENTRLVDIEGRLSSGRTDSANIEEQIHELEREAARLSERKGLLLEERNRRRGEIALLQNESANRQTDLETRQRSGQEKEKELEGLMAQADSLRDQLAESSSQYEATLARKNLLAEMIEHYEGFAGGVVAVFETAGRWPDIAGTVADFLHPRDGYQTAIDAALGDTAQYIISTHLDSAREAIAHLLQKKAGRATFLILEKLKECVSRPPLPQTDGVVGWADELVSCDDRYRLVPPSLLGRTVVCNSQQSALEAVALLPEGYRAVTTAGDLVTNEGLFSGGASEELSLVGRKDEVAALGDKLAEWENRSRQIRNRQAEVTLAIGESRQQLTQIHSAVDDDRERLAEASARLKEEQFKVNAADEIITSIDQQHDQLHQRLDRLQHRQYTLTLDFDSLDKEKESIAGGVREKKARLADLEEAAQKASEDVNRAQMSKIETESRQSHLQSQRDYFDEMLADIAANVTQKEEYIRTAEEAATELSATVAADEKNLQEMFTRREEENRIQQARRHDRDEIKNGIDTLEEQIKGIRRDREQMADEIHTARIRETELQSRLEQLEERIRGEYRLDIRELAVPCPNPDYSEEQIKTRIETLRDDLEKMGVVNLLALEEYDEQKQRQDFLSRQLDDLISAKATLRSTIQKINQTARTLFLDTIHKARENFKHMYQELFTGGEADVILEDESDPLESRIEIISRPRGKKPLTITQLSGGERALTAIALLFALYMVKPSPFCFLDEIDAPLDDVNIGRFLKIVRKFSTQTQFIIITHNKITMEAADTLFGITMEEPGVSKMVAVRFRKETEDDATILELHYAKDDATQAG